MFKKFIFVLISLVFLASCATQLDIKRLEDQIQKQSRQDILRSLEGAAGTKMYGRTSISGGSTDLDDISTTGLADGDLCIVIDSNGVVYFYKYSSSSTATEVEPFIVTPSSSTGRWILAKGLSFKNDGTEDSYIRLYEDYDNGQSYYDIKAPSSITTSATFTYGRARISATTFTSASTSVGADDTDKLYYCTTTGLTGNYGLSLPAASGTGVKISAYIVDDSASYRFIIEPNGTDRIVGKNISGTNADGDYIYPSDTDTTGAFIELVDAASGRWVVSRINGAWSWE